MTTKNRKLTTKDYELCFDISKRTAQRMFSADKKKLKVNVYTALHFYIIYGFQIVPICAIIRQSLPNITMH